MLILPPSVRHGLSYAQIWYPTGADVIRENMAKTTWVAVYSADFDAKAAGLEEYQVKSEEWWTTSISLGLSEDEILKRMDPKSCRYEVRKAEKLGYKAYVNERSDEAYDVVQGFIKRKGYRNPMTHEDWRGCTDSGNT